jgi:hypothetical protein
MYTMYKRKWAGGHPKYEKKQPEIVTVKTSFNFNYIFIHKTDENVIIFQHLGTCVQIWNC